MAKKRKPLNPTYHPRTRKEYIDYDYSLENHPEAKKFMESFTDEYYGGAVQKTRSGRVKKGHLHKNKQMAKDCYDRNNRQNNDVLGVTKANGLAKDVVNELQQNDGWYINNPELTEMYVISNIEKNEKQEILTKEEYFKLKDKLGPEALLFYLELYENE